MRYMPFITTLVVCFMAQPAFAMSQQFPKPSGTYCDSTRSNNCFTISSDDQYEYSYRPATSGEKWGYMHTMTGMYYMIFPNECWYVYSSVDVWRAYGSPSSMRICVFTGGQYVMHRFTKYRFPDIPTQDMNYFSPEAILEVSEKYSNNHFIRTTSRVKLYSSGDPNYPYCFYFNAKTRDGYKIKLVGLDRTPDSIMNACGFKKRLAQHLEEERQQQQEQQQQNNNNEESQVSIPESATRCGAISNGVERVTVRSARHSCNQARNVLRSYSRSLRSPSGWTCSASMNDATFKARCSKKTQRRARTRAAVYGIWTRR